MESILLLGICTIAWLAWLPAVLLEKEARGDKGGTSIVPIILLVVFLGSAALSAIKIKTKKGGSR